MHVDKYLRSITWDYIKIFSLRKKKTLSLFLSFVRRITSLFFPIKYSKVFFIFYSLKSEFYCYSAGVVKNGKVLWGQRIEDQCQNTSFQTERWIPLKVSVRNGKQVSLYGNNGKIAEWTLNGSSSYGSTKAGLLVRNAFNTNEQTRIYFKDLKISIVQ